VGNELQQLVDRAEISDLLAAYSTAIDTQDWAGLAAVFTPDAECDYGTLGNPHGPDEIAGLVSRTLTGLDATQHLVGNVVVHVDGDRATAECYLIAQHVRGDRHYLLGGRYSDRVVRTPQGWRIAHRTLHRGWATGDRSVLARP
jgi:3-phenylpropionate/cinnamic acid dioxygenase small subunit